MHDKLLCKFMMAANQQGLKENPLLFGLSLSRLQLPVENPSVPPVDRLSGRVQPR